MKSEGGRQKAEPVLVCFALKEEAGPFRKMAAGRPDVSILVVGIGRKNAEKAVRKFLDSCSSRGNEAQIEKQSESPAVVSYRPGLVLTCGFAGGLNPDLKIGEVVFEISRSRGDEAQIKTRDQSESPDVVSYEKLISAGAKPVKFFCSDRIATTVAEKKKLRDETGADAVEMESEAIHAVCAEQGIPCMTVRVISDTAHEDLPLDFNQLAKPDQSLDFGKLFLAIAKSPGKIPALMQLGKKTKFAAERLAEVLGKITTG